MSQSNDRIKVNLFINKALWEEIKRLAFSKHENFHGALSYEVEQCFQAWLALHTQNHTKQLIMNGTNPQPKVYAVFQQVKDYMKKQFGYAAIVTGQQVPKFHIEAAVSAIRGSDPRTVQTWINRFLKYKLLKWLAGQVYEVV